MSMILGMFDWVFKPSQDTHQFDNVQTLLQNFIHFITDNIFEGTVGAWLPSWIWFLIQVFIGTMLTILALRILAKILDAIPVL